MVEHCWNNGQGALAMPENDTNGFKNSCKYKLKIVVGYPPMRSSGKVLEQNIISYISCQLQRASLFVCRNLSKIEQSWRLNVDPQALLPVSHSSGCVGAKLTKGFGWIHFQSERWQELCGLNYAFLFLLSLLSIADCPFAFFWYVCCPVTSLQDTVVSFFSNLSLHIFSLHQFSSLKSLHFAHLPRTPCSDGRLSDSPMFPLVSWLIFYLPVPLLPDQEAREVMQMFEIWFLSESC